MKGGNGAPRARAWVRDTLACLLLAGLVLLVFWRVAGSGTFHDDDVYATAVPQVQAGLTADGVRWAFTTMHAEFWHPVTWLSLMLDRELFGPGISGHHVSAMLIHLLSTLLLFLAARRLTGRLTPALLAAALFATHPTHVQTVAWVADRKDLLAAFFCFLALLLYRAYAARPGPARYAAALAAYALGLMAKPSLVTLPVLLLLLDWWPLGRLGPGGTALRRLIVEKLPFLALSVAMTVIGYLAQARTEGIAPLSAIGVRGRVTNALVAGADYARMTVWPSGLASHYPHPGDSLSSAETGLALAVLAAITSVAVLARRSHPHLLVGWAWFGGMLLPVVGLIQVGNHAMADRYSYVPHAVPFLAFSWWLSRLVARRPHWRSGTVAAAVALVAALSVASWREVGYWHDGVTRYGRDLAVAGDNWFARLNLGLALVKQRDYAGAEEQFRAILRLDPSSSRGHGSLALALALQGRLADAEPHAREAVRRAPRSAEARNTLAWILAHRGAGTEAEAVAREAIALDPALADAHVNLATILAGQDRIEEASASLETAIRLNPDNPDHHYNLAILRERQGRWDLAEAGYRRAVALGAADADVLARLASAMLVRGDARGAIAQATRAIEKSPSSAEARYVLGRALVIAGDLRRGAEELAAAARLKPENRSWSRDAEEAARLAGTSSATP